MENNAATNETTTTYLCFNIAQHVISLDYITLVLVPLYDFGCIKILIDGEIHSFLAGRHSSYVLRYQTIHNLPVDSPISGMVIFTS
jgi:hypothetical protein